MDLISQVLITPVNKFMARNSAHRDEHTYIPDTAAIELRPYHFLARGCEAIGLGFRGHGFTLRITLFQSGRYLGSMFRRLTKRTCP
jgi:hypothetical protein